MRRNFRNIILSMSILMLLVACAPPEHIKEIWNNKYKPINILPMYGYPYMQKTESQKEADKKFIDSVTKQFGSREKSAIEFSKKAWAEISKGNNDNAMRRFNQSWLLDENYYMPYWGFGLISFEKNKPDKAITYFEKSLSLIDNRKENINIQKSKSVIQRYAVRSYAWEASINKETDIKKSKELYKKANSLIDDILKYDPKNRDALTLKGVIAYDRGDYNLAWEIVKKGRAAGHEFDSKFIENLSKEMTEP